MKMLRGPQHQVVGNGLFSDLPVLVRFPAATGRKGLSFNTPQTIKHGVGLLYGL